MDIKPSAIILKTEYGFSSEIYPFMNKSTWGTLRQYERWPFDRTERELIRIKGMVPAKTDGEWSKDFMDFVLYQINEDRKELVGDHCMVHCLQKMDKALMGHSWYHGMDEVRRGVILDVVYKNGLAQIVQDKPLVSMLESKEYRSVAKSIICEAQKLFIHIYPCHQHPFGSRSYYLSEMMRSGEWPKWVTP